MARTVEDALSTEDAPSTEDVTTIEATPAVELGIDPEVMDILGVDPTLEVKVGPEVNSDVSVRLQHYAITGLSKEDKKELTDRYLIPRNCKLIDAPAVNAEVKRPLSEVILKRDKAIEHKQKFLGSAISGLGEAITMLISSKDKDSKLLRILMDIARILCDCQHADTITRRNYILNSLKKELRDQLQNTKVDAFLFGQDFSEALKAARNINKLGDELKETPPKPVPSFNRKNNPGPSKNLNWKSPYPKSRQSGPPRTREPASARQRPLNSFKMLSHQPQHQFQQHQRPTHRR